MKYLRLLIPFLLLFAALFTACGEDRSSEQPFPPTVVSETTYQQVGDSVLLRGRVAASPNSSLRECGFTYGNDTLKLKAVSRDTAFAFSAFTDSLGVGSYYAVAYARNGMGEAAGDTIRFVVE